MDPGPRSTVKRKHQLDLLRILFALLVLLAHAPELTDGDRSRELFTRLTHSPLSFGEVGVDGFFLLSGYLILQSWLREPRLLDYMVKRVLRIVPGYLVAVVLSVTAAGLLAPSVPHYFRQIDHHLVHSVLMLQDPDAPPAFSRIGIPGVNRSLWTIFYEFHFYCLVALLGICGLLRRRAWWAACTAVLLTGFVFPSLLLRLPLEPLHYVIGFPRDFFRLGLTFFVGGCFYLFRQEVPYRPALASVAVAVLVTVRLVANGRLELALILAGGYLLFYLNHLSLPSLNWMRRFPDISYGMYLYGWPVEALLITWLGKTPWLIFALATVACVVLGWLRWHFVERPCLRLRRHTAPLPAA